MPSFVIEEKCDGCKGGDKTACMYICPNDLMVLDPNAMKAYNQEPDQCWECFSCVKICPTQAIEVRGYADFVPAGKQHYADAGYRRCHVDLQVQKRPHQTLQVPHPDHSRRCGQCLEGAERQGS